MLLTQIDPPITPAPHFWGARPGTDGQWDFALWAPSASAISLLLPDDGRLLPLHRGADGVHRARVRATEGSRYGFSTGGPPFADPASLQQESGAEGWSLLRDPDRFRTGPTRWPGRPFDEAVFCELHVGSFTRQGTFGAAARSPDLRRLADLGITAIELMPVGQFPGQRGWGYDSVLPWAPQHNYGTPEELATLVDKAHSLRLMVFLDVVFNHFGPEGAVLTEICPEFFRNDHNDWGRKIDYARPEVRAYFLGCAQHWLRAYDLDGLRLDAVHSMEDETDPHIVPELARTIRQASWPHPVHLVAEDSSNKVGWYDPDAQLFDASWDDDYHHALHVLLTQESFGYYKDFARDPLADLCTALRDGQVLQGQPRPPGQERKGQPSGHLPFSAFVDFTLNHDQADNRPRGERLISLIGADRAVVAHALLLAAPFTPLLFMGEEIGSRRRFPWFADYAGRPARKIRDSRMRQFRDLPGSGADMVDPFDPKTIQLCWPYAPPWPVDAGLWQGATRDVLDLRRRVLLPLFRSGRGAPPEVVATGSRSFRAIWHFQAGSLSALVSFDGDPVEPDLPPGHQPLYSLGQHQAPHIRLGMKS